ncbi:MAG: hypothetical protein J7K09_06140 [Desulfuromusa sp.]|nr:hypothetical protein [Desulfuromusa sp.]
MKTTLAFLTAGLIFLATPILASADRGYRDDHPKYGQGWDQSDRYTYNQHYRRHDQRKVQRYGQKHNHRIKKSQVREMRQVKRSTGHNHRRIYYAKPAILIGIPPLVLLFDW